MQHLLTYQLFEARNGSLTSDQQDWLNRHTRGSWTLNPRTGLVDVDGNFDCSYQRLKSFLGVTFGRVSENFYCHSNQLVSLAGAPRTVGGYFVCSSNQLVSLAVAPRTVEGGFYCHNNELTTLEGAPQTVGENFDCQDNKLVSLAGAPQTVEGNFQSDAFRLEKGKWNVQGWVEVLRTGSPEAQKLILTLPELNADYWNQELQQDPGRTVHRLAPVWSYLPAEIQRDIRIPPGHEGDFDLFSGLADVGLF